MPTLLNAGPSERGWSRLGAMLQCPQKYAYTYVLPEEEGGGKQIKNKTPIVRGSLIHVGLAHHYRRMQARSCGEDENEWFKPLDAIRLCALQDGDEEWLKEVEHCQNAVTSYIDHYGEETFQVVAVEQGIFCMIGEYKVTGRADLIVQDRQGKIWVIDHKTTSRINNSQKNYYGISGQLIGYEYMGRQIFGDKWGGMILNLVQHKEPYKFQRVELPPAPNMLARFPDMVREAERRIEQFKDVSVDQYPMAMNELVCYHRYGACEWIEKCKWGKNF